MATRTNRTGVEQNAIETEAAATEKQSHAIVAKEVDLNQFVTVRNGFQGTLVYKSKRTGEVYIWSGFGDEQEIDLRELRNAKNSYKKFFENNWFMFEEDWVVDFLGVGRYYKNAIGIDEFDSLFELPVSKLKTKLKALSAGQKKSVAYRARTLVAEGKIDSLSVIHMLEEALGVELIEK